MSKKICNHAIQNSEICLTCNPHGIQLKETLDKRPARERWIKAHTRRWPHILNGAPTEAEIQRAYLTDYEAMIKVVEFDAYQELVDTNQKLVSEKQTALDELAYYKDLHDRDAVVVDITAREVFRKERDEAIQRAEGAEAENKKLWRDIVEIQHKGAVASYCDLVPKAELTAERAKSQKLVAALDRIYFDCETYSSPDEREALILRCMEIADNALDAHKANK